MRKSIKPRILLLGVGRFGIIHLKILQKIEQKGLLKIAGIVVRTEKSRKNLSKNYDFPIFKKISAELMKYVDAVDIVTPYRSHYDLVKKCLRYCHVLVEKPLTATFDESKELYNLAKKKKKILMVGHIYRFHPVITELKKILSQHKVHPHKILGKLLNPSGSGQSDNVPLEFMHYFDIMDYIFGLRPIDSSIKRIGQMEKINLRYPKGIDATFYLGWSGREKIRVLDFDFKDKKVKCNFPNNEIKIFMKDKIEKIICNGPDPLDLELQVFLKVISGHSISYPDAMDGAKINKIIDDLKT